jgi:hypothetical protein
LPYFALQNPNASISKQKVLEAGEVESPSIDFHLSSQAFTQQQNSLLPSFRVG